MPAAQYDHAQLKEMFKTENKAFKLKVLRGGETKDFEFTTRILI